MSGGDGPPPVFDGDDFPYWKIRMEAYLEAIDIGVYKAATQGFPQPRDPTNLVGDEFNYEKWNAKAKNTLFRGLCKDVFKDRKSTPSELQSRFDLVCRLLLE